MCNLSKIFKNYPALTFFITLLSVILPPIYISALPEGAHILIVLSILFCIFLYQGTTKFFLASIIAILSFYTWYHHQNFPSNHYIHTIPNNGRYAQGKIILKEATLTPDISWLPHAKLIQADIFAIDSQKVSGSILVRLPTRDTFPFAYGDICTFQGNIITPDPPIFQNDFDFSAYLRTQGTPFMLVADSIQKIDISQQLWVQCNRKLLAFRDVLLEHLCANLSPPSQNILAALFFGCKQGIDHETKTTYIQAGTIHILVVSGLHMVILGGIFYLGLCFMPYRYRGIGVCVLLFLFLATTGFQTSALRSWIMFTVFLMFTSSLRSTLAINSLIISGMIVLLLNPFTWCDLGFRYSFTVTFFLILSWRPIQEFNNCISEPLSWIPVRYQLRRKVIYYSFFRKITQALLSCAVAMISAIPITTWSYGMFIPLSFLLNVLVIPLISVIMGLSLLKMILGTVCSWITPILDCSIDLLTQLCTTFSDSVERIAHYGNFYGFEFIIIWGTLILCCVWFNKKIIIISATLLILFFFAGFFMRENITTPVVTVAYGGKNAQPSFLICDPKNKQNYLINTGDIKWCSALPNYLRRQGIKHLHHLIISAPRADYYRGLDYILQTFEIQKVTVLGIPHKRSKIYSHYENKNNTYNFNFLNTKIDSSFIISNLKYQHNRTNQCFTFSDFKLKWRLKEEGKTLEIEWINHGQKEVYSYPNRNRIQTYFLY